jgi:hypothetical protein
MAKEPYVADGATRSQVLQPLNGHFIRFASGQCYVLKPDLAGQSEHKVRGLIYLE